MSRTFSIFALILCLVSIVNAQEKFGHLRSWVGKYPTYDDTKPHREFLKLPEIRQPLLNLISRKNYRFITVVCGKEVPIEQIDNYLIVRKCHSHYCLRGMSLVIINIKDGAMYVAIRDENDSEARWFSSRGNYKDLPLEVKSGWIITNKSDNSSSNQNRNQVFYH